MIYIFIFLVFILIFIIWIRKVTKVLELQNLVYSDLAKLVNSIYTKGKNRAYGVFKIQNSDLYIQWYLENKIPKRLVYNFPINEVFNKYKSALIDYLDSNKFIYFQVEYEKVDSMLNTDKRNIYSSTADFIEVEFSNADEIEPFCKYLVYDLFQLNEEIKFDIEIAYRGP